MPTIRGAGKTNIYVVGKRQRKGREHAVMDIQFVKEGKGLHTVTVGVENAFKLATAIHEQALAADAKPRKHVTSPASDQNGADDDGSSSGSEADDDARPAG